jgi:D-beta-D-heptose 7-phosphate kinase / D-beta-D-heptose 1-phosphate adenosyltransferase
MAEVEIIRFGSGQEFPRLPQKPHVDWMRRALEKSPSLHTTVVGDVMLDRYISGLAERISAEAPVPVLRVTETTERLGGAGNVCANIVALGARCQLIGAIGPDPAGTRVSGLAAGLDAESRLLRRQHCQTTVKTRVISGGQQLVRLDDESSEPLTMAERKQLLDFVSDALKKTDVLVLSDYGKGVLAGETASLLIRMAKQAGKPVLVDPKGMAIERYAGAEILKPNLASLMDASEGASADDDAVGAACLGLIRSFGFEWVVATRGGQGLSVASASEIVHIHGSARQVRDVTGAGDTVLATLAVGVGVGLTVPEAACLANVAGSIVVAELGCGTVSPRDLMNAICSETGFGTTKLISSDEAIRVTSDWRRNGLRVGFTNGCFDLIHPGHISMLTQARQTCDRLVVGLNSDASVRRLKGRNRPIQDQNARAFVLGAIAAVDLVVIFEDDTPIRIIEAIQPDFLFKGADYKLDQIVGADIVQARGGKVVRVRLVTGQSTSSVLERLLACQD